MTNMSVTHAESGLVMGEVVGTERISPHIVRVTVGGGRMSTFTPLGFDQWVRLAIPTGDDTRYDNLAERYGLGGYVRYLTLPRQTRPVIRAYTVRQARPEDAEVDIDVVVHGDIGVGGPWAVDARIGSPVGMIDQGCGWRPPPDTEWYLLVGDESALPAICGILRDLPRDARGHAFIELGDEADRQPTTQPDGVQVEWVTRPSGAAPGEQVLAALVGLEHPEGTPYAFAVGERSIAVGARRHLIRDRAVDKRRITFCGYWRQAHTG